MHCTCTGAAQVDVLWQVAQALGQALDAAAAACAADSARAGAAEVVAALAAEVASVRKAAPPPVDVPEGACTHV